ncbi:hypothetical protein [Paenibacillus sp. OV219]|uniref:hypothetical protein n=1 Tax=Paenibacillus sp. OV219 TaxID=1884377 RepID=UPI0008BC84FA|nr:hypothetical protein [Paenibacillus sp. OV219]SEN19598.1 hypothetical protein SAMN05518847_102389 [Paenibacillus sp. OV219]
MKKILVSKGDNAVLYISNIAEMVENGINVGGMIFGAVESIDVFDVDQSLIPENCIGKYSYNPTDGFTVNLNWQPSATEAVTDLQNQQAQIILALVMNDLM